MSILIANLPTEKSSNLTSDDISLVVRDGVDNYSTSFSGISGDCEAYLQESNELLQALQKQFSLSIR